jgi:hypothetical protein
MSANSPLAGFEEWAQIGIDGPSNLEEDFDGKAGRKSRSDYGRS